MWLFDIYGSTYNPDLKRRFFLRKTYKLRRYKNPERDEFNQRRQIHYDEFHTVSEEWCTPDGIKETADNFDHYTFTTMQEAYVFVANLAMRLNTPWQNILISAAEDTAMEFLDEIPQRRRQFKAEKKILNKQKKQPEKKQQLTKTRCVYVFDMSNGSVKIGVSNNVQRRKSDISNSSGLNIKRWCHTKPLADATAFPFESECHSHFKLQRKRGEFFNITFEEACEYLQRRIGTPLIQGREEMK